MTEKKRHNFFLPYSTIKLIYIYKSIYHTATMLDALREEEKESEDQRSCTRIMGKREAYER